MKYVRNRSEKNINVLERASQELNQHDFLFLSSIQLLRLNCKESYEKISMVSMNIKMSFNSFKKGFNELSNYI